MPTLFFLNGTVVRGGDVEEKRVVIAEEIANFGEGMRDSRLGVGRGRRKRESRRQMAVFPLAEGQ